MFSETGYFSASILVKTKSEWPFVSNPLLWVSRLGGIKEVRPAKTTSGNIIFPFLLPLLKLMLLSNKQVKLLFHFLCLHYQNFIRNDSFSF